MRDQPKKTRKRRSSTASANPTDGEYYFDEALAWRWREIFPTFFKHIDGELYGEEFNLLPFWMTTVVNFFCWKHRETHRRKHRTLFVYIPRKNVKTMTVAAVTLAYEMIERPIRGQAFVMASTEKQADIIFGMMVAFVAESPDLKEIFFANDDYIQHIETLAKITVLTSAPRGKTGFKPDFLVCDEFQEQKDLKLIMKMKTGGVANKQPVFMMLGTCGEEDETASVPWRRELDKAKAIAKEPEKRPSYMSIIFETANDADPGDPRVWAAANPGYGLSVDEETLAGLWEDSKDDPVLRQEFCQYNLNMQVRSSSEFFDLDIWDDQKKDFGLDFFAGKQCYAGLDIGETDDMTAFNLWYPQWGPVEVMQEGVMVTLMHPHLWHLVWYFSPTQAIKKSERKQFIYTPYVNQGLIKECGNHSTNFSDLKTSIVKICKDVRVIEAGHDPYHAKDLVKALTNKHRIKCIKIPQNMANLDHPTRRFKDMVYDADISHNGNPVFRWNLTNVRVLRDTKGNRMISKKHSLGKIDGVAASINGLAVFLDAPPPPPPLKVYSL